MILVVPLIVEFLLAHKDDSLSARMSNALWLFFIPLGLGLFMLYQTRSFGEPLAFIYAHANWGRSTISLTNPLEIIRQLKEYTSFRVAFSPASAVNTYLEIFYFFFGIVLSAFVLAKIRLSYGLYSLLNLLVPLSTGSFLSQGRFVLVLFPLFLPLARWGERSSLFHQAYTLISSLFFGLNILLFVNGYWIG